MTASFLTFALVFGVIAGVLELFGMIFIFYGIQRVLSWLFYSRIAPAHAFKAFTIMALAAAAISFGSNRAMIYFMTPDPNTTPVVPATAPTTTSVPMTTPTLTTPMVRPTLSVAMMVFGSGMCLALLGGVIGGLIFIVRSRNRAATTRRVLESRHVTKFQVWLQDCFVGALAIGLALTVLTNMANASAAASANNSQSNSQAAAMVREWSGAIRAYATVFNILGLLMSFAMLINVCQYSLTAQIAAKRAAFIGVLLVLSGVAIGPMWMVATWLAWRRWMVEGGIRMAASPLPTA